MRQLDGHPSATGRTGWRDLRRAIAHLAGLVGLPTLLVLNTPATGGGE